MSGLAKTVGKAFKAVFKVVKKVALPVLAIGAVVLTGGAALGVLPSLGTLGSSLGLSSTMTGILATAAKGATLGAVTSAVTGGDIVKGATMGFATGGVLGGIGAMTGGAATTAAQAAKPGLMNEVLGNVAKAGGAAPVAANVAPAVASGGGGILSGVGDFINKNPFVASSMIQGIGAGLMASEQSKAAQREREAVAANYQGIGAVLNTPNASFAPNAAQRYDPAIYGAPNSAGRRVAYDPQTGRIVPLGG